MINYNLVGRCGLYCGACVIYRAYKDSEKLRKKVAERARCQLESIRCEGCQKALDEGWDVQGEPWGRNCKILKCLESKRLKFCFECNVYPDCDRFREVADSCHKYGEDLVENLARIEAGQVKEWLKDEDKKWRCEECGKPIAMHLTECHWCGIKRRAEELSTKRE